jgi:hypothetical protein
VAEIARLCGYLPLAVGMLARQLHHHPAWSAGGRAAELAGARSRTPSGPVSSATPREGDALLVVVEEGAFQD